MQAEGGPEGRPGKGEALRSEGAWAGAGEAKTMGGNNKYIGACQPRGSRLERSGGQGGGGAWGWVSSCARASEANSFFMTLVRDQKGVTGELCCPPLRRVCK